MRKDIDISTKTLFTAEVLAKSGTATSTTILDLVQSSGVCQFQYVATGTGTFKVEALESIDGVTYTTNGTPLASTKGAGNGIFAKDFAGIRFVKIKITEDGGAQPVTVTLKVNVT